jgi:hypothetical protein
MVDGVLQFGVEDDRTWQELRNGRWEDLWFRASWLVMKLRCYALVRLSKHICEPKKFIFHKWPSRRKDILWSLRFYELALTNGHTYSTRTRTPFLPPFPPFTSYSNISNRISKVNLIVKRACEFDIDIWKGRVW